MFRVRTEDCVFGDCVLTQALVDSRTLLAFAMATKLEARQPPYTGETQLLVDEEEEDGKQHDEDADCGQEADGLGRYCGGKRRCAERQNNVVLAHSNRASHNAPLYIPKTSRVRPFSVLLYTTQARTRTLSQGARHSSHTRSHTTDNSDKNNQ